MTFHSEICDASSLKDFRSCQEFARLRHEQHLEKPQIAHNPLSMGALLHEGLAKYSRGFTVPMVVQELSDMWRAADMEETGDYTLSVLVNTFENYVNTYRDDGFVTLSVEEYLESLFMSASGPFRWGGKIDKVVQDREGGMWVLDHKTSKRKAYNLQNEYAQSTQMLGYINLVEHHHPGWRIKGAIIDHIVWGKPQHFQRVPVIYSEQLKENWRESTGESLRYWRELRMTKGKDERWPQNGEYCWHWGRVCQFFERCEMSESVARQLDDVVYVREEWDPRGL